MAFFLGFRGQLTYPDFELGTVSPEPHHGVRAPPGNPPSGTAMRKGSKMRKEKEKRRFRPEANRPLAASRQVWTGPVGSVRA